MSRQHDYTAWAEIDLKALRHNFREIRRLTRQQNVALRTGQTTAAGNRRTPQILSVVKADAYGHGMLPVVHELTAMGTDFLGVSECREGVALRANGVTVPILIFETPLLFFMKDMIMHELTATVGCLRTAQALNACAQTLRKKALVHIKIDTGMGRLGIHEPEAEAVIKKIMRLPHLCVTGLYTHFPSADTDRAFTKKQAETMSCLIHSLDRQGLIIPYLHAANSMGIVGYPCPALNVVRTGLMLYGLYPAAGCDRILTLKPVMSVKARVIFVKTIEQGRSVSYGRTFIAKKRMTVATIGIGYNDGYLRAFSNKAFVLIGGQRCRVLGRVTMDQVVVDVTHAGNVRPGNEAVIIGRQKENCVSADELADYAATINYEIVCLLGNRLPKVYY